LPRRQSRPPRSPVSARPLPPVGRAAIVVDGELPEFRDTLGDPAHRNHRGYDRDTMFTNATSRNDITAAKVGWDDNHVYSTFARASR
jgi:hypothetical protein